MNTTIVIIALVVLATILILAYSYSPANTKTSGVQKTETTAPDFGLFSEVDTGKSSQGTKTTTAGDMPPPPPE